MNQLPFIPVSRLGFGCAPVMGRIGKRQALKSMAIALDYGVTHFDTARSYGFGDAEAVLGQFLKARRSQVTVTTKFGVVPPKLGWLQRTARPLVRIARKKLPGLGGKIKQYSGALLAETRFDTRYAAQCLHESLQQLQTEYIDIYLLHEPTINILTHADDLFHFFEKVKQQGKIRTWGIAYQHPRDRVFAPTLPAQILQFEGNNAAIADCQRPLNDTRQCFVTRPFSGGNMVSLPVFMNKMTATYRLSNLDMFLGFSYALSGTQGCVICSMFSEKHIVANTQSIARLNKNKDFISDIYNKMAYFENA